MRKYYCAMQYIFQTQIDRFMFIGGKRAAWEYKSYCLKSKISNKEAKEIVKQLNKDNKDPLVLYRAESIG